ncbi:hypothetical protein OU663_25630, partial [Escherichia coli]|nr:hypothetical protein [Escherichia coli]
YAGLLCWLTMLAYYAGLLCWLTMLALMRMSVKCFMWQEKKGCTGASAEYVIQDIFRFLAH